MRRQCSYLVKEVAQLSGVSVRALHHYHKLGLLVPHGRSQAGYRLYDEQDLLRLQQILIGRELGLPLAQIKTALDEPQFDYRQALISQREKLVNRVEQTSQLLAAVDTALNSLRTNSRCNAPLTGQGVSNMATLFNGFNPADYELEAQTNWGGSNAFKESTKRTHAYKPEDWKRMHSEQSAIYEAAFATSQAEQTASSQEGTDIAEKHRLFIDRWFYSCSHAQHAALADLYEEDPRFAANIDKFGAGLSSYLSAAIRANAARTLPPSGT